MREFIILILLVVCIWQGSELSYYKKFYWTKLKNKSKKDSPAKEERESFAVEYDGNIPHPYK